MVEEHAVDHRAGRVDQQSLEVITTGGRGGLAELVDGGRGDRVRRRRAGRRSDLMFHEPSLPACDRADRRGDPVVMLVALRVTSAYPSRMACTRREGSR